MISTDTKNVDTYISSFPDDVQSILENIRSLIRNMVPEAAESISYGMPAYKLKKKPLIYFAAFKEHIGIYALPSGNEAFKDKLRQYKTGKGSIQFPLQESMPFALIKEIIEYRKKEITGSLNER